MHSLTGLKKMASTFSEALHCILDAYQEIGEEIPLLISYQSMFTTNQHMQQVLKDMYIDILEFHREAMKHFRSRCQSPTCTPGYVERC